MADAKARIRQRVWDHLEAARIARFPFPPHGRIPNFAGAREAEFRVGDCLQGVEANSRDLVLINPPFHQQHSIGDAVAWQMFKESRRVLQAGGELRIVGNRHLGYHAKLKKLFGNCETIAANRKFVVLSARR